MKRLFPDRFQQNDAPEPSYFCERHGDKLTVTRSVGFNVMTGKQQTTGFLSKCPRWFCGYSILTGVVPPRPDVAPAPQGEYERGNARRADDPNVRAAEQVERLKEALAHYETEEEIQELLR